MKILEVLKNADLSTVQNGQDTVADMYYRYKIKDLNKPIVITFPPNREKINNNPNITPFNFNFLCRYDINILCFGVLGAHKNNYFMHPEFSAFIEKLGVALKPFKIRLGYANSKGGFGIGAYANALKLDHAILFHPVSTKNIALVPWDNQATTKASQHLDWSGPYGDVNMGECKGFVIYDPLNPIDVKHANRFPNLKHIKMYGYGHSQGYYFLAQHSDLIKEMLNGFINKQEVDITNLRKKGKLLRTTSYYYTKLLEKKPQNKTLLKSREKLEKLVTSPQVKPIKKQSEKNINTIRDSALALEKISVEKALNLMKIALELSPKDSFIINKVNEYTLGFMELSLKNNLKEEKCKQIKSKAGKGLYFDHIKNKCITASESKAHTDNLSLVALNISASNQVSFFTIKNKTDLVPLFLSKKGLTKSANNNFKSLSELIKTNDGYYLIKTEECYLCAEPSGKVLSNRKVANNWERFSISNLPKNILDPLVN